MRHNLNWFWRVLVLRIIINDLFNTIVIIVVIVVVVVVVVNRFIRWFHADLVEDEVAAAAAAAVGSVNSAKRLLMIDLMAYKKVLFMLLFASVSSFVFLVSHGTTLFFFPRAVSYRMCCVLSEDNERPQSRGQF